MICPQCKKDHGVKNDGPLTVCERKEYFSNGSQSSHVNGGKYRAFGTGNRFQFDGAKGGKGGNE